MIYLIFDFLKLSEDDSEDDFKKKDKQNVEKMKEKMEKVKDYFKTNITDETVRSLIDLQVIEDIRSARVSFMDITLKIGPSIEEEDFDYNIRNILRIFNPRDESRYSMDLVQRFDITQYIFFKNKDKIYKIYDKMKKQGISTPEDIENLYTYLEEGMTSMNPVAEGGSSKRIRTHKKNKRNKKNKRTNHKEINNRNYDKQKRTQKRKNIRRRTNHKKK